LDKYCNKFYIKNNESNYIYSEADEVYGFIDNIYTSPTFVQNVIANTEFKGTTGWVGTYSGRTPNAKSTYGVTVESVYGRFDEDTKVFYSVTDDLQSGVYGEDKTYTPYLKIVVPKKGEFDSPILLNTGFYDKRIAIE
jgi:hypothetical protein